MTPTSRSVNLSSRRPVAGCLDFSITADSIDPARIRIYERWESEDQLLAFRGAGPSSDQKAQIIEDDVKRYTISSVGEP
ncbi:hypothetical protein BH24ACT21_BH24ACT21_04210 [soil metagenome]